MKIIHHDHIWIEQRCRQHGAICKKFLRGNNHDIEIHIKTREPKPTNNTDGPPCIGCKGNKKGTQHGT